jgi:hypothetical protein
LQTACGKRLAAASAIHLREIKRLAPVHIFHKKMLEIQTHLRQAARPLWQ